MLQYISDAAPLLREKLVVALTQANYVRKLLDLFAQCEDLCAESELATLFEIFKALVLLNDTLLLEHLFAPDVSLEVFGVFEYDPAVAPHNRVPHRKVLATSRAFREVVSLGNEQLRQKVHQTHRMVYLKEVVLPRVLDDNTLSSISSLVYFNQVEIVTHLRDDKRFVGELFERLRTTSADDELHALVLLLQEFCLLARNLQLKGRTALYETLMRAGLYECVMKLLTHPMRAIRLAMLDVLGGALVHNAAPWRQRSLIDEHLRLGDTLVHLVLADASGGVRSQCAEALRLLLHTDGGPAILSSSYVGFGGADLMMGGLDGDLPFLEDGGATAAGAAMDEDHLTTANTTAMQSPTSPPSPTGSASPHSPEGRRRESGHAQRMSARGGDANGDWMRVDGVFHRQSSQSASPPPSSPPKSQQSQSSSSSSPPPLSSSSSSSSSSTLPPPPPPPPPLTATPAAASTASDTLYSEAAAFTVNFYERGLAAQLLGVLARAADAIADVPGGAVARAAAAAAGDMATDAAGGVDGAAGSPPPPPPPPPPPVSDVVECQIDGELADTVCQVIELFGFCVQSHGFRAHTFATRHDFVGLTARLCASTVPHVALAAIRFMRLLVSMPDDFYARRIQRFDLLRWMLHAFVRNGPARNLLNSAVISFCSAIRESNNKPLVAYVVKNYAHLFADIEYVDTFRLLQLKHEQNEDAAQQLRAGGSLTASSQAQQSALSVTDTAEDEYFENDADDANDAVSHDRKRMRVAVDFVPRPSRGGDGGDDAGGTFSALMAARPTKRPLTLKLRLSPGGDGATMILPSQQQQQQQQPQQPQQQQQQHQQSPEWQSTRNE